MKQILLFIVALIIGVAAMLLLSNQSNKQTVRTTSPLPKDQFSIANAPTESIRGKILSMSGNVDFESRTATQPAILKQPMTIQQGESVVTKTHGLVAIQLEKQATISVLANSEVDFIQTLPDAIVIDQPNGTATYTKTGNDPLAIQSMDLLIQQANGETTVNTNTTTDTISVTVSSGSAQLGFDDLNDNSNIIAINAGNEYIFDDDTRQGAIQAITQ